MSQESRQFEESVADAADCIVEAEGSIDAAIDQLVERRSANPQNARIDEALAYLRHRRGGPDG